MEININNSKYLYLFKENYYSTEIFLKYQILSKTWVGYHNLIKYNSKMWKLEKLKYKIKKPIS